MSAQAAMELRDGAPLAYRAIEPATPPTRLLALLHGVGGNETNLIPLGQEVTGDTLVVFPRAPLEIGAGQFAWFPVRFGADGPQIDFDEAMRSTHALQSFLRDLQARHGIRASRSVIAGFSQGGIMSANVGLTAPDVVSGVGVLSGRILPDIEPLVADAASLRTLDVLVVHGVQDNKLPPTWAQKADALLTRLDVPHATRLYPAGHEISAAMQRDFLSWLQQK